MPFWFSFSSHWPGPRSLAATNGVSVDVLSSSYLDVSVRSVRLILLCIQKMISLNAMGCPIRKSTDQSLLTAPRGLSQPATSFFASECQGIHQMPFFYFIRSQKTEDIPFTFQNLRSLDFRIRPAHVFYVRCAGFTACPSVQILKSFGYRVGKIKMMLPKP